MKGGGIRPIDRYRLAGWAGRATRNRYGLPTWSQTLQHMDMGEIREATLTPPIQNTM